MITITIEVGDDFIKVEGRTISRPIDVSRTEWKEYWKRLATNGLSERTLMEMMKFMGEPGKYDA
jgi:hypothetical protein